MSRDERAGNQMTENSKTEEKTETTERRETLREQIRQGAAVVDGWPEWKRNMVHLFGHPKNVPQRHKQTSQEKAKPERIAVETEKNKQRDGTDWQRLADTLATAIIALSRQTRDKKNQD
jgi:hypothetical protein